MKEFFDDSERQEDAEILVNDFLDTRYKDYAKYVLYSRAIPSVVDGLKPSQRKALYTAIKEGRSKIKTAALAGYTVALANYHHGEGSISGTLSQLAAEWNNNVPLFHSESNMGSRMVKEAASPRYTFVSLSKEFESYFTDFDILEPTDDPEDPEPRFYLPLIPWVLVNGIGGTAIGYATKIQPRDPKVLAKISADWVSGKITSDELRALDVLPHFEGFRGKIYKNDVGQYVCRGLIERQSGTQVNVLDIPTDYDREKYVSVLDDLEEKKKIVSYEDKGRLRFSVRLPNASKDISDEEVYKLLKLERVLVENITVIDEHGRLKVFDRVGELILHFLEYRISRYPVRFVAWGKRDRAKLEAARTTLHFINDVLDGTIVLKDKNRQQLVEELKRHHYSDHLHQTLLNLRTYQFCSDEIEKLREEEARLVAAIEEWTYADPKKWFAKELKELT